MQPFKTIQFFGLPGSGKSYLLTKLIAELNIVGFQVRSRQDLCIQGLKDRQDGPLTGLFKKLPDNLWHRLIHEDYCLQEHLDFISNNPLFYKMVLELIQRAEVETALKRSILGAIARTSVESELAQPSIEKSVGMLLLADEWFYHRIYTLYSHCDLFPTYEQIKEFIVLVPNTAGTVFIATPPHICMERMQKRGAIPEYLAELSSQGQMDRLARYYGLFEMLHEALLSDGRSVITYDGQAAGLEPIVEYCKEIAADQKDYRDS